MVNKMLRYLSAEMQKMKRTFTMKLLWIAPLVPLFCAYGSGQRSGIYFWYCAFLPGVLTILCSLVMLKDSKLKFHGIFSLPINKGKSWVGKILACSVLLFLACIIFFVLLFIWGLIPPYDKIGYISTTRLATASVMLFVTLLWQIPLCLFLSAKHGIFLTIILNMFGNIVGGAAFANEEIWTFPYAVPFCSVGPVLKILPNGLVPDKGSFFLNNGYILPEILFTIVLFAVLSGLTTVWFCRQEAK
jgi:lantibiotic protection ABC transporter MutE/EpiE family permease subunit